METTLAALRPQAFMVLGQRGYAQRQANPRAAASIASPGSKAKTEPPTIPTWPPKSLNSWASTPVVWGKCVRGEEGRAGGEPLFVNKKGFPPQTPLPQKNFSHINEMSALEKSRSLLRVRSGRGATLIVRACLCPGLSRPRVARPKGLAFTAPGQRPRIGPGFCPEKYKRPGASPAAGPCRASQPNLLIIFFLAKTSPHLPPLPLSAPLAPGWGSRLSPDRLGSGGPGALFCRR